MNLFKFLKEFFKFLVAGVATVLGVVLFFILFSGMLLEFINHYGTLFALLIFCVTVIFEIILIYSYEKIKI